MSTPYLAETQIATDIVQRSIDTIRTLSIDAVQAHEKLTSEGIRSRVVSMPSWDVFEEQPRQYRGTVLLPDGRKIGMETFGASAPLKELQRKFGFEPDEVVLFAKEMLGRW